MRAALDARREALSELSDIAASLLRNAGHNPTLDTTRRITATLEALSAYALHPDGPIPGHLTHDVDPPGFESLTSFDPGAGKSERTEKPLRATSSQNLPSPAAKAQPPTAGGAQGVQKARKLEETRQVRLAAAKVSLQDARKLLTDARARAQKLGSAQKKADAQAKKTDAEAKEAEKQLRTAEQRFRKTNAAAEGAAQHLRDIANELEKATKELEEAHHTVNKVSKELETLFRELPVR